MMVRFVIIALCFALQSCLVIPTERMVDVDHAVVKTESGVTYQEHLAGTGKLTPEQGMTVTIDYTCQLEDGTEVDSTYSRGQAVVYVYGEAWLAGIDDGLVGMRVGGRRKVTLPSEHAYGENGVEGLIPPNSALIFKIELIALE